MLAKTFTLVSLIATSLATPLTHLHTRSLLPNVTIKALPAGCASYPGYNADTGIAGPWSLTVSDSENPDLLNYGPSTVYSLSYSPSTGPVMRWGYLVLGYTKGIARTALQCQDDKLNALADTSVNAAGAPGNAKWTPLALSPYSYDASLLYLVDGEQPTLYEHYIGEEKQPGWYLGGYNTTTWGVKWYEASSTSYGYPYFYLRLLPAGEGLKANETRIFLKFQA
ncbi:hypothetical protein EK21DRAFT_101945 [Setomelanomma holmii]|uniref:Uncharacterized protein n=1 Tax=Setomelanomma holmii TaxID=210430 RepID=A0A9P4LK58_9PLEO|nr:hypothetical protein EK21DRAFT_101945 [Setomelanomma holmii]